jgi:polyisoprenyl-phosphate glycosyltransferase
MRPSLCLVVPCYNEEEVLTETSSRLLKKISHLIDAGRISDSSRILFVNDGSKDSTWKLIVDLHEANPIFSGLNLARNRGHQNALLAGLMFAKDFSDFTISLDADLQDDIEAIDQFISEFEAGCDIVYGVRSERETDTLFKRTTALSFYRLMKILGVDIVFNHADYRLMSKRAVVGLQQFKEVNLFLRGIVPMIGYKFSIIEYVRHSRFAGESKYPLKKMLAFALDGITSLSVKPIRVISGFGLSVSFLSVAALIYTLIAKLLNHTVVGWSSLAISIWMLGGAQLLAIGVIGEYIGKIYLESKQRPRYIIADTLMQLPPPPPKSMDETDG